MRLVTCAGANTARNPPEVTDVALRKPRRQSSLDREEKQGRKYKLAQPDWVDDRLTSRSGFTVSGRDWGLKLG